MSHLGDWCLESHLIQNVSKTKLLIVDLCKVHACNIMPVYSNTVDMLQSFSFSTTERHSITSEATTDMQEHILTLRHIVLWQDAERITSID